MIATSYPFLDVMWTLLVFFAWVIWFYLLITVFGDLFRRHDARHEEFALVASLVGQDRTRDAVHDLLDSAFLLRWMELTSNGRGPQELPPLIRRPCGPPPLLP